MLGWIIRSTTMIHLSAAANIHNILIILGKTYKVILRFQIGQQPIKIILFASTDSHWIYTLKRTCSKVHACLRSMNTFNKERNFSQRVGAHILDEDWILPRSSTAVRYRSFSPEGSIPSVIHTFQKNFSICRTAETIISVMIYFFTRINV